MEEKNSKVHIAWAEFRLYIGKDVDLKKKK